jgi:intein-encoded DNA endonuclease-like protein
VVGEKSVIIDWGYVGGYFDGEGCVFVRRGGYVSLIWTNTHLQSLEALQGFLGCGYVKRSS